MNSLTISINIPTLIVFMITLLATGVFSFLFGYIYGKYTNQVSHGVYNIVKTKSIDNIKPNVEHIKINEGKVVVDINTDNLAKKYESLGDIKESTEDISTSINKLKNLKK